MTKGMTPITKNINVIDAAGNQYEATYPKRAKGLVKKGRAIFIDEQTLCLDCPPSDNMEDNSMNSNDIVQNAALEAERGNGSRPGQGNIAALTENTALEAERGNGPRPGQGNPAAQTEMSLEWVMAKMDAIIHDNFYIREAFDMLKHVAPTDQIDTKSVSIGDIVEAREATNQQALKFLEKIYDGLKPTPADPGAALKHMDLAALSNNLESEHVVEIVRALVGKV